MADLSWIEAIQKVLAESNSALDYNEISNIIATTGLWTTACLVDTDLGNPLLILYSKTDWACKA